jgi:hypothetical protein
MSLGVVARRLVTTYAPDPALAALRFAAALLLACGVCTPVFAQTAVDLQLVLSVDASGSVDQRCFELQQQGYVAAFRDPRVLRAIQLDATQVIAVTMVEWTGPALQIQVLPSTLIKDTTTAHAFAAAIAATPRRSSRPKASPASRRCEARHANNQ